MKNYSEYYKQLGNLLYSIAAVGGNIAAKEWGVLRRIVKEELVPIEAHVDEFGSDAAFAVEFQFDILEGNQVSTKEAWDELLVYLKHNAALLPEQDKQRMSQSAQRIALAFHGINHAEHNLLHKLENLLK